MFHPLIEVSRASNEFCIPPIRVVFEKKNRLLFRVSSGIILDIFSQWSTILNAEFHF